MRHVQSVLAAGIPKQGRRQGLAAPCLSDGPVMEQLTGMTYAELKLVFLVFQVGKISCAHRDREREESMQVLWLEYSE